jgi:hypothetical protein
MKKNLLVIILAVLSFQFAKAQYINFDKSQGGIDLAKCSLIYSEEDFEGVKIAVRNLQNDIFDVSGRKPELNNQNAETQIIIGTIGKTKMINAVLENTKIDISQIQGKWETGMIKKINDNTILIIGADKRGTIFAVYDLCKNIGVSPWKYWADVPAQKHDFLGFKSDKDIIFQTPKVKYRGIFLNDEEPCLGRWAVKNFGGFNHKFYEKVFELLLRLKCNFMWPAMWWAAFNEDDPLNSVIADNYGIVMGNSHHEPMNRSYAEWHKTQRGAWNFQTNNLELEFFWQDGIKTMGNKETIVTIGMRGDGDEAMEEGKNYSMHFYNDGTFKFHTITDEGEHIEVERTTSEYFIVNDLLYMRWQDKGSDEMKYQAWNIHAFVNNNNTGIRLTAVRLNAEGKLILAQVILKQILT